MNEDEYYIAGFPEPPRVRFGNSDEDQSQYGRFQSEHFLKDHKGNLWCYHVYENAVVCWSSRDGQWVDYPSTWFEKEKARRHWDIVMKHGGEIIYRNNNDPVKMHKQRKSNWYKAYNERAAINAYQKANNLVSDKEWEEARLDPAKFYEEHLKGALSNYALEA